MHAGFRTCKHPLSQCCHPACQVLSRSDSFTPANNIELAVGWLQERQAALERQVSQYVEQDAVIQPELPARCMPPLFGGGGDIYSKRFVRLSRPPAGMSMLAVRAPRCRCRVHGCASGVSAFLRVHGPGIWRNAGGVLRSLSKPVT